MRVSNMDNKWIILPLIILLLSCNRYIDRSTGNNISVQQGHLNFYADSNVLVYKSNIGLTRDTEKVYPKAFKVKLPKKIKYYEFVGSTDFAFYYDNGQVVLIKVNLESPSLLQDTSYIPAEAELNRFIQLSSTGDNHRKYNAKEIASRADRINKVIAKGDATILLYNIVKKNENLFSNYLNSFSFLSQ